MASLNVKTNTGRTVVAEDIGKSVNTNIPASLIKYDNTDSKMKATNVQSALEEINFRFNIVNSDYYENLSMSEKKNGRYYILKDLKTIKYMNEEYDNCFMNGDIIESIYYMGEEVFKMGGFNVEVSGITPLICNDSIGKNAVEWEIMGNGPYQEWTPSPEPEMSANIFNQNNGLWEDDHTWTDTGEDNLLANRFRNNGFTEITEGEAYTINIDNSHLEVFAFYYDADQNFLSRPERDWKSVPYKFTPPTGAKYVRFVFNSSYVVGGYKSGDIQWVMVNKGSSALEYVPYGPKEKSGPCEVKGVGERTENLLNVKEQYPSNIFTYSGEEITAINTAFAQNRINLSSYIGKTLTFSAEVKKESGITRAYIRAIIDNEYIDSAEVLDNSKYKYLSITFTPKTVNDVVGITYGSGTNQMSAMHIMLNEGSTALPYEPYGYKTTVVDGGKNLFDKDSLNGGMWLNQDGTVSPQTGYSVSDFIRVLPNTKYTLSNRNTTRSKWYDINKNVINPDSWDIPSYQAVVTTPSSARYLRITVANNFKDLCQLEIGDTATEYTPYRPSVETTIYSEEPYFVGDYVRKDKDGGAEHSEWNKRVLTGVESYDNQNSQYDTEIKTMFALSDFTSALKSLLHKTTHFRWYTASQLPTAPPNTFAQNQQESTKRFFYFNIANNIIGVNTSMTSAEKVTAFKAWLKSEYDAGHPVIVYYKLATPTDTQKDLPELFIPEGYNSIDTDTEIKPASMSITYKAKKPDTDMQAMMSLLEEME